MGPQTFVADTAEVHNAESVRLGSGCTLRPYARIYGGIRSGGSVTLGDGCWVGEFSLIDSRGGSIEFGAQCSVNPHCVIYGHGGLKIGRSVRIAAHTVIIPAEHVFESRDVPIIEQGLRCRGIVIEDDVWIGASVVITDGVKIGQGAVVGAGAVVTHDIPSFQVWVGVPARFLKDR